MGLHHLSSRFAALLLTALAAGAQAQDVPHKAWPPRVFLSPLPAEQCNAAMESQREVPLDGAADICLLAFAADDDRSAQAQIDGQLMTLVRTDGPRARRYQQQWGRAGTYYASSDGQYVVRLNVRVVASSCEPDTNKCCGETSQGHLTLWHQGRRQVMFPVGYYRGG